jgi:HEAT repeat protein
MRKRLLFLLLIVSPFADAAEVVWLDGRRETVSRVVVRDDRVLVSFAKGLRSVPKRRIVKAAGDDGAEIALDRKLVDGPPGAPIEAALAGLPDASPDSLPQLQEQLADSLSRAAMERLVELTTAKKAEVRTRAASTLLLMGVDEPLRAGLAVALGDKDREVRLRLASALYGVTGALDVAGLVGEVAKGLEDRDTGVRAAFAMVVGRLGDKRAIPVLKSAGLKNRDHHVRESAAEVLAELGDDAGVTVLIGMLTRTRHPAGKDFPERLFVEEKVRVCRHLGRLRARKATSALEKAARSKHEELAKAAREALAAIGD